MLLDARYKSGNTFSLYDYYYYFSKKKKKKKSGAMYILHVYVLRPKM